MTSEAQINANRENAKKSTGPRTEEGKRTSRLNPIKHGMYCAASTLRQLEGGKDFEILIESFRQDIRPHGALQEALVEQLASMHHRIRRYNMLETFVESKHIIQGGDFVMAMARDHNIAHDSIPKLANMAARLHREFRATIKTLFEVQRNEPVWLDQELEQREQALALAELLKTKPIYPPPAGEPAGDLPYIREPKGSRVPPPPASAPPEGVENIIK